MILEDWRDVDPRDLEPLYAAECARYRAALGWDYRPSCNIIEEARRSGRLPGLVLRSPHGPIGGWAYFVVHEGVLQVGGLVATTAAGVRRMLDRVLQAPEATFARALSAFVFPVSSSVQAAFERQRFAIERHPYLSRPLGVQGYGVGERRPLGSDVRLRPLGEVDPADVVRLTARAYAGLAEARCFAPDGRLEQWAHYLGQLLATPACGEYRPGASFAVERRSPGREVVGAVITTALSAETAHIAQIVVDPSCRRAGLAFELVAAAGDASRQAGHSALSLIVAEANRPARALYARMGFVETASFIYASRAALTRRVTPPAVTRRQVADANLRSAI
jgi:ribosomal protein S18 acetylase RimI-like enzyme